ncbi:MAG TPA: ABC transporter permease [Solirubrobacteraceae bacterium]|jgi:ABC-2 type transport system permease protein|nr:ABC transporter permease [Solirubrobacteraceae bacterium]
MSTMALPSPATVSGVRGRLRWAAADACTLTRRNLTHVRYVPEKLIDVTLQPIMFVLLFVYVFGKAIHVPGGHYQDFLMAGIFVQSLAFASAGSAVSIAEDLRTGAVERFRSLPTARAAILLGRTGADLVASALALAVLSVSGLIVGWHVHGAPGAVIGAYALLLLFAYAMSWVGVLLGTLVRAPDAAQGMAFLTMFPLTFIANSFVPLTSLPSGLRAVAQWNPLSAMITAARHLFQNPDLIPRHASWELMHPVLAAALWCVVLLVVTVPLAVWRYQRVAVR